MKILNNLVLIEPIIPEETTKSGIIIANYAPQSKFEREVFPNKGTVIAFDEKLSEDFKVGDVVHFLRWGATACEIDGKDCLFINPKDILAKEE